MTPLQRKILNQVRKIRPGTTLCAGQLSRKCDTTLANARRDLIQLALDKKITLRQRNLPIAHPCEIRGPFRVGPAETLDKPAG